MDSRPLGRTKGKKVNFVADLEIFRGKHTLGKHTFNALHTMIELGDIDCYWAWSALFHLICLCDVWCMCLHVCLSSYSRVSFIPILILFTQSANKRFTTVRECRFRGNKQLGRMFWLFFCMRVSVSRVALFCLCMFWLFFCMRVSRVCIVLSLLIAVECPSGGENSSSLSCVTILCFWVWSYEELCFKRPALI